MMNSLMFWRSVLWVARFRFAVLPFPVRADPSCWLIHELVSGRFLALAPNPLGWLPPLVPARSFPCTLLYQLSTLFSTPLNFYDLCLRYLRLTSGIRSPLDFVGLTLLRHLVLRFLLNAVFSTVGFIFTRFNDFVPLKLPTYLLVRACQPDLALGAIT